MYIQYTVDKWSVETQATTIIEYRVYTIYCSLLITKHVEKSPLTPRGFSVPKEWYQKKKNVFVPLKYSNETEKHYIISNHGERSQADIALF